MHKFTAARNTFIPPPPPASAPRYMHTSERGGVETKRIEHERSWNEGLRGATRGRGPLRWKLELGQQRKARNV